MCTCGSCPSCHLQQRQAQFKSGDRVHVSFDGTVRSSRYSDMLGTEMVTVVRDDQQTNQLRTSTVTITRLAPKDFPVQAGDLWSAVADDGIRHEYFARNSSGSDLVLVPDVGTLNSVFIGKAGDNFANMSPTLIRRRINA